MNDVETLRPRWRLRYRTCPRSALYLTDTPRPSCRDCHGAGGWEEDYADHTGEHGGTATVLCDCWSSRAITLLPLGRVPAWLRRALRVLRALRRRPAGCSDEPPF